jgi:ATP-dependent Clp protease ATP-binding subunit ClpE
MTSNAGTNLKANGIGFGSEGYKALESKVKTSLNEYFKPEFLNRVDEVVIFNELNNEELVQIAGLMLNEVSESVHARKMTISYDDGVKEFIAKRGFDPKMGARPMRRVVQTLIEDKLADLYIKQEIKEGDHINASLSEDGEDIELKKIDSLIKKAPRSRRKLVDGPSVK